MTGGRLLERDDQMGALAGGIERAATGDGSVWLVAGPAGIGKTALLDIAGDLAAERGLLVLRARASELDRGFGFGIVHQLLGPVVHAADAERRASLFVGAAGHAEVLFGATAAETDPEYGVLGGLFWLVANLAEERPVALLVDDLHWADAASLRMLEFLARRIADVPVLIAATVRSDEPGALVELLAALETASATTTIRLAPLSPDAVAAVVEDALGAAPAPEFRDAAWRATGGNPLLVTVLGREAAVHGLAGRADERESLPKLAAHGVAPSVVRRLAGLGDATAAVARVAAVLGERARHDDLVALSGLAPAVVRDALGRLADAQIIEAARPAYVHPLVRAAVVASMPHGDVERLHRSAAARLRDRGAPAAEVALHWLVTRPAGDADAARDLWAAGREAAAEGATSTAIDLLRRALDEHAAMDRPRLLLELAELELRTLAPEGPARMRDALASGLDGPDAVRGRAALGTVLLLSDPRAALAQIDAARAEAVDGRLRRRLEASALEALVFVDDLAAERSARYEAIRAAAEPSVVELAHLASEEALRGRPAGEVAALAGRALADGRLLEEIGPGGSTWSLLTHALRFAEDPEAARRVLSAGDRAVRERGLRGAGAFVDQSWGYWHRDFGSVARGLAHAQAGYDAVAETGLPVSLAAVAASVAENLVLLDRLADADALMDLPLDAVRGTFVEAFAVSARGLARMMVGREAEAEADLRRVVEILDARGWHAPNAARGRLRLAELLAGQGHTDEALELIAHDVAAAHAAGTRGALGHALRVQALALTGDERLATLRRATGELAASPLRLEHGRALLALGAHLRRRGRTAEARGVLREALDAADRTESAWLARLVRAELEAAGARPRRARTTGIESLTPSERRTAELAAEGLTNREVAETLWVTRKTVEYHLSNVYAKLGVPSRDGLRRALAGQTLG